MKNTRTRYDNERGWYCTGCTMHPDQCCCMDDAARIEVLEDAIKTTHRMICQMWDFPPELSGSIGLAELEMSLSENVPDDLALELHDQFCHYFITREAKYINDNYTPSCPTCGSTEGVLGTSYAYFVCGGGCEPHEQYWTPDHKHPSYGSGLTWWDAICASPFGRAHPSYEQTWKQHRDEEMKKRLNERLAES